MSAIYDANEYLIAGLENQAEWWEHLGDAHRDYAALAREAVALRDRAEAAEAECARLRAALLEMESAALKAAQLLPMTLSTSVEADHRRDHPSWAGWLLRQKVLPVAREALAAPDTPADSQEDKT